MEFFLEGGIDLKHGCFNQVLYVPEISINPLSSYKITHTWLGNKVEFTLYTLNLYLIIWF